MEIYNLKDVFELKDEKISEFMYARCYKIYKLTNTVNNKSYIGDSKLTLHYRFFTAWWGSHFKLMEYDERPLYKDLREFGLSSFTLEELPSEDPYTEQYYIELYDTYYNGYNLTKTGLGRFVSGDRDNKLMITDGNVKRYVEYSDFNDNYDKSIWRTTGPTEGYKWMHKGDHLVYAKGFEKCLYYEDLGYEYGFISLTHVTDPEGFKTRVKTSELQKYFDMGYVRNNGGHGEGKKKVHKPKPIEVKVTKGLKADFQVKVRVGKEERMNRIQRTYIKRTLAKIKENNLEVTPETYRKFRGERSFQISYSNALERFPELFD